MTRVQQAIEEYKRVKSYSEVARIMGISRQRVHNMINYSTKEVYHDLKDKVFEKFGNKCFKCGFTDWRALQIDHVNGGGMKEYGKTRGRWFLKRVLKDSTGKYQLLCANCNWIKRYENGE